jgi:hypothetical protein
LAWAIAAKQPDDASFFPVHHRPAKHRPETDRGRVQERFVFNRVPVR